MWNVYLKKLRGGDVWRAAKFANPRTGATVEALTDREGNQANTLAEQEKLLRGESFPMNDGDLYYAIPPVGQAHERITKQLVDRALFTRSLKKAPSPEKLSFGAIRLLWRTNKMRMIGLTKEVVRTERHPTVSKR